jgi:hypothetical protein
MKMTDEQFNSLPQLDRIEYINKLSLILNNDDNGSSWLMAVGFMICTVITACFSLSFLVSDYYYIGLSLLKATSMFSLFTLALYVYAIWELFKQNKELRKIRDDYFEIDIKPKRKNVKGY